MRPDDVIETLRRHRAEMRGFSVSRLAVFGSLARGQERQDSDVDILVAFEGRTTFDRYFDLKFWLEELLGRPVDLVTENALRPEMAAEVHEEAVYVAP